MNRFVGELEQVRTLFGRCIRVNHQKLEEVAHDIAGKELIIPQWREIIFPQEDDDTIIEFLGIINTINFCFTDFETGKQFDVEYPTGSGTIWYGSSAMTAAVKRALDEGYPFFDYQYLRGISEEDLDRIFRYVTTPMPMAREHYQHLKSLGVYFSGENFFKKKMTFASLFREADFYAFHPSKFGTGIVEVLSTCSFYNDRRYINLGRNNSSYTILPFMKRAQLLAMMYYGRAKSSYGALPALQDPEAIGPITDYAVPHVLHALGILEYSLYAEQCISRGGVLAEGCPLEIEIRLQTTFAMRDLLKRINELREQSITMAELDYVIWSRRKEVQGKHHYTYTTAY